MKRNSLSCPAMASVFPPKFFQLWSRTYRGIREYHWTRIRCRELGKHHVYAVGASWKLVHCSFTLSYQLFLFITLNFLMHSQSHLTLISRDIHRWVMYNIVYRYTNADPFSNKRGHLDRILKLSGLCWWKIFRLSTLFTRKDYSSLHTILLTCQRT